MNWVWDILISHQGERKPKGNHSTQRTEGHLVPQMILLLPGLLIYSFLMLAEYYNKTLFFYMNVNFMCIITLFTKGVSFQVTNLMMAESLTKFQVTKKSRGWGLSSAA